MCAYVCVCVFTGSSHPKPTKDLSTKKSINLCVFMCVYNKKNYIYYQIKTNINLDLDLVLEHKDR